MINRYLLFIIILITIIFLKKLHINRLHYDNTNNIHSIVFVNALANGDAFISRIIVKHIIKCTPNLEHYYNGLNSISSHCKDIGIPDENFNVISIPEDFNIKVATNDFTYKYDNGYLFVNPLHGHEVCWLCLHKYLTNFNKLINDINNKYGLNINYIETINNDPYISFNYDYYDIEFIKTYILDKQKSYDKIILYYNNDVRTKTDLNKINHNFILQSLSNNNNNYLFITFKKLDFIKNNIISINEIYENHNKIIPIGVGIQFSYISILSNKVIGPISGNMQLCLHNENKHIKNKFLFINNSSDINHDNPNENLACVAKFDWFLTTYIYDTNDNKLYNYINDFIYN